jgi:hypothetical protein
MSGRFVGYLVLKMKTAIILPKVVHLSFPNRKEMSLSLCRTQEHYEAADPRLREKYFSWEVFLDAFSDSEGKISYFSFWSGFNFPGQSYLAFLEKFGSDLSPREEFVRDAVLSAVDPSDPFYVIGTLEGAAGTILHESLHALYHVDPIYRRDAIGVVLEMDHTVREKIKDGLSVLGYGENVLHDEIQAYMGSGAEEELARRFGLTTLDCSTQCPPFKSLVSRHLAQS